MSQIPPLSDQSASITVTLPTLSAAVALEAMLDEEARDNSQAALYTRRWHRQQLIEALRDALVHR